MSLIATFIFVADKGSGTFGIRLSGILRGERWEPSPLLLEPEKSHGGSFASSGVAGALGSNRCRDRFQAVLAHGFCQIATLRQMG